MAEGERGTEVMYVKPWVRMLVRSLWIPGSVEQREYSTVGGDWDMLESQRWSLELGWG